MGELPPPPLLLLTPALRPRASAGLLSGVKESRRDISIQPTREPKEEQEESRSFPGLRTQYRLHHMEALVGGLPWGAFETEVFDEVEKASDARNSLFIRTFKSSTAKKDSQRLKHKSLWEWGTEATVVRAARPWNPCDPCDPCDPPPALSWLRRAAQHPGRIVAGRHGRS